MILVQAIRNDTIPNRAPAELVEVAAFGEKDVSFLELVTRELEGKDPYCLDVTSINMSILNVGDSEIGIFFGICRP